MDFSRFRALYMFFTASAQQPDATFATYLTNTMTCHSDLSAQGLGSLASGCIPA